MHIHMESSSGTRVCVRARVRVWVGEWVGGFAAHDFRSRWLWGSF